MGVERINQEYESFRHELEVMVSEEVVKIRERVKTLEINAERIGEETEKMLIGKKVKKRVNNTTV